MSDRFLGVACFLIGAAMALAAQGYAAAISYEPVGPRAFPLLLSGLMMAMGAWLAVRPSAHSFGLSRDHLKPIAWVVLAVVVYAALFELLGFTLATTCMAVPVGMAFGGHWKPSLMGGIGLGLVLFVLFDKVLDVVLPSGLLAIVLGGR
jgi:putative tricarboxylic transport membrane protein